MIIDFHTHCFPDAIALKAIEILRGRSGIFHPYQNGTVSDLIRLQKRAGVDKSVIQNIATNPHQQKKVNDFAISLLNNPDVIPFGSVHPDSEDAIDELYRLREDGIKGIKLHPDYQEFYCDDDRMLPLYEKIAELGFITLFHCGIDMGYPKPVHCDAQRLSRVLHSFGNAPVIAAHLGGICDSENVIKHLAGKDVYLDTAFSYGVQPPVCVKEIITAHGADKILMASDSPWNDPADSIALIKHLGFDKEDEDAILGNTAAKLLGLRNAEEAI